MFALRRYNVVMIPLHMLKMHKKIIIIITNKHNSYIFAKNSLESNNSFSQWDQFYKIYMQA